jgi:hypothetical protein
MVVCHHPTDSGSQKTFYLVMFALPRSCIVWRMSINPKKLAGSAMLSSKLIKNATLKVYPGGSHSLGDTSKEQLNADLFAFIKGEKSASA